MKKRSTLMSFLLMIILAIMLAACSGQKASELYDTAKFEELQNNREHAIQIYEQLIDRYPSSDYVLKAKERIDVLKKK
jgi:outer membrane protein assembly factor BamD (BamD/ComL family)